MTVKVGILVFDGVDELDFGGPLAVFGAAGRGRDGSAVVTIGGKQAHFRGGHGLKFSADYNFSDAPQIDVLVVPGGRGTDQLVKDAAALEWVRSAAASADWICSVCTGSFVLQAAGLTVGRRITTHSAAIELLRSANSGQAVEDQRYVVDGNMVTSAGVSAGIDMSLWVVGQIYGEDHGKAVRKNLEYYPDPPF